MTAPTQRGDREKPASESSPQSNRKRRFGRAPWLVLIVVVLALAVVFKWLTTDPDAPRFEPVDNGIRIGPYDVVHYRHLTARPFQGGKLWVMGRTGTNRFDVLLFDIDSKRVVGRLLNAEPDFMDAGQTRLVCRQRDRSKSDSTRARIADFVFKISRGRLDYRRGGNDEETIWIVDMKSGRARRTGSIRQLRGAGSSFYPSPDFRRGYVKPTVIAPANEMRVCDLETGKLELHTPAGWPMGWWDNQRIILRNSSYEFVLYDVASRDVRVLLTPLQLRGFFDENKLVEDPQKMGAVSVWNGRENAFFLTDTHKSWLATNSVMIKVDRETEGLELWQRNFKHEWLGHIHPEENLYVFNGRENGQGSASLYLRDLTSGVETALIASNTFRHFSIPHFYGDEIIYQRSNSLWRVDLKGVNHRQIFPPR